MSDADNLNINAIGRQAINRVDKVFSKFENANLE